MQRMSGKVSDKLAWTDYSLRVRFLISQAYPFIRDLPLLYDIIGGFK